jgi:hypothetical protein
MFSFDNFLTSCITVVILAIIIAITIFHFNQSELMAKNIESAIAKGIDPLSVRCSYARADDIICITFAAKNVEPVIQSVTQSKK